MRRRPAAARALAVIATAAAWIAGAAPVAAHENEVMRLGSFLGGLTHPVLGPDHLLAMVSVGVLSAQIGGRALLTVPATFVGVMAIGATVGLVVSGIPMGAVELGIGGSVLLLGAIIAAGRRLPILAAMTAVGFFATFHGYAHGVETPTIAEPVQYALGFLGGTALLHLAGVLIGEVALRYRLGHPALRLSGVAVAVAGLLFVTGLA
ncbi:MAG: nickel uptake transporter HupE [Chloroflexota bacterium]